MTRLLGSTFLIALTTLSCGEKKPEIDNSQINNSCDKFMQLFKEENYSKAIDVLRVNSAIEKEKLDSLLVTIKGQMQLYLVSFGKQISYDLVAEKKIKEYLVKRFYLLRFENSFLKFSFTEYKSAKGWTITSFNYDDEIDDVIPLLK